MREWTATGVRVGGVDFGIVKTSGRKDTLDFIETIKAAAEMAREGLPMAIPAAALASSSPSSALVPTAEPVPLLLAEIKNYIVD